MDDKERAYLIKNLKMAADEDVELNAMNWIEISVFNLVVDCLFRISQLEKQLAHEQPETEDTEEEWERGMWF